MPNAFQGGYEAIVKWLDQQLGHATERVTQAEVALENARERQRDLLHLRDVTNEAIDRRDEAENLARRMGYEPPAPTTKAPISVPPPPAFKVDFFEDRDRLR